MVNREALRFWGWSAGVAVGFAALVAVAFPYGRLGLTEAADREWGWLATVWSGGVMAILFGLSGVLGWSSGVGIRDIFRAGGVKAALAQREKEKEAALAQGRYSNFGWWLVATGGFMICIYFIGWLVLR
jgi:hypothetical protein